MTSPDLPPLPPSQMNVEVWDSEVRGLHQANAAYYTADQLRAVQLAAYMAGMLAAAQIAGDMPITYERDGHLINTVPEDYEAAIRRAAEGKTDGN